MSRNQPDIKEAAARPFWAMEAACARAHQHKGGGYPRGPEGRSLEETEKRTTGRVAPCGGRHWRCEEGSHQEVNALSSITALRPRPFFWREMLSPNSSARVGWSTSAAVQTQVIIFARSHSTPDLLPPITLSFTRVFIEPLTLMAHFAAKGPGDPLAPRYVTSFPRALGSNQASQGPRWERGERRPAGQGLDPLNPRHSAPLGFPSSHPRFHGKGSFC